MGKWKIDENTTIKVSSHAANVIGTSAELLENDTLTLKQLLFGLMLPSGNDAAHCLAEYFGGKLKAIAEENEKKEKAEEQERLKREKEKAALAISMTPDTGAKKPSGNTDKYLATQDKETNAQSSSSGNEEDTRKDIAERQSSSQPKKKELGKRESNLNINTD